MSQIFFTSVAVGWIIPFWLHLCDSVYFSCNCTITIDIFQESIAPACKFFVEHLYKEENKLKSEALLSYLEHLVKNNVVSSK